MVVRHRDRTVVGHDAGGAPQIAFRFQTRLNIKVPSTKRFHTYVFRQLLHEDEEVFFSCQTIETLQGRWTLF